MNNFKNYTVTLTINNYYNFKSSLTAIVKNPAIRVYCTTGT